MMKPTEIPADVLKKANEWLTGQYDEKSKAEVKQLLEQED